MNHIIPNIIVIGGGGWGAAIASQLAKNTNQSVTILVRDSATKQALSAGQIPRLPDCALPVPLSATTDEMLLCKADAVYLVLPAAANEQALAMITHHTRQDVPVILCAKGLIEDTEKDSLFLSEYMESRHQERPYALLSGPSFADEVLRGLPAALVAASHDEAVKEQMINHFSASDLRLYNGSDPIGVAIGGAVKNIIALAAGISTGLGLGDNARAALITRGLAETARLTHHLGGDKNTLSGLAGIGDLLLSATGPHSRNMAYGMALGAGTNLPDQLCEGARSAPLLAKRAEKEGIEMPVTKAVARALEGDNLTDILSHLLARPAVRE